VLKRHSEKDSKAEVSHLCKKIERATLKLRNESMVTGGESEDDDVRFSDKVLGDAKRFIAILLFTTFKFYQLQPFPTQDSDSQELKALSQASLGIFDFLKQNLIEAITKIVVAKNVYKIILAVCRHETLE